MMEEELRRRLEDAADAFRLSERAPARVFSRARIRMAATAGLAAVVIAGVGVGASYGISAFADRSPPIVPAETPTPSPSPTDDPSVACEGIGAGLPLPDSYRTKGDELAGDVDGTGGADSVTLRIDKARPERCRYVVVVEISGGPEVNAVVAPLDWPGTDPNLLLLAEIDGHRGLEPVVELAPAAVYRPGAVYTMRDGALVRMRLDKSPFGELFPFYDEFPAGSDCTGEPGTIVVSFSELAEGGTDDSHWDVTRTFYRATGDGFERTRREEHTVEVGPVSGLPWLELNGDPFVSCPDQVR